MALEKKGPLRSHEGILLTLSGLLRMVLGLIKCATEARMRYELLCSNSLCSSPGERSARTVRGMHLARARCWREEESKEEEE
jgi:hypothetical protein